MLRLGLICDFAEEHWTSMDLVGEMLHDQMSRRYGMAIRAERIRPEFHRRVSAPEALREWRTAWNGDRLWNRVVDYPRLLRRKRDDYDLFHIVDHSYAHLALELNPGKTVVTCHDLDAFRCLTEPSKEQRPYWFRFMARRILQGLRSAAHVIFVSHPVRRDAINLGLVEEQRTSVIYNGVHADQGTGDDADREAARLSGPHANVPLLLNVGSTVPRKRIDILLRVFAGVVARYPAAKLVRAGGALNPSQAAMAKELGIAQSIIDLPFVEREVLSAIYRRATILLQPSEAEGFGLPVAEAMACGCPVVASDIPVLREIGGNSAVYCSPGDVPAWTACVTDLLGKWNCTPSMREEIRSRGIENSRRFSWTNTADRVVDVYRKVAGNG